MLQVDRLQRQLELRSRNTQTIHDELENVKTKSLAEEANALEKLQRSHSEVQNLKDENRRLSNIIREIELAKETTERAYQELARRSESLQKELEKAREDHREVVAQKEHLERENHSVLLQLLDGNERDKKNLQLIRDLEQEIRLNANGRPQASPIRGGLGTATAAFADRPAISDQVSSPLHTTESSPAVDQHEIAPSPPQATNGEREVRQPRVNDGASASGTGNRSTAPLSPPSSPSPIELLQANRLGPTWRGK